MKRYCVNEETREAFKLIVKDADEANIFEDKWQDAVERAQAWMLETERNK